MSRKKTGTLPTHSDPRSWVDFAQARPTLLPAATTPFVPQGALPCRYFLPIMNPSTNHPVGSLTASAPAGPR